MLFEVTGRHGFVGGIAPLDLTQTSPRGPEVGQVDGARLVVMGEVAHRVAVERELDDGKRRIG